jgi:hypothetical protein
MKQREKKLNEWRSLLEERKQRNLTIKDFCKERNITPSQFYYYQQMVNKPKQTKQVENGNTHLNNIKPIQLVNSASQETSSIRFILPNGMQCILPCAMKPAEVKVILELLMSC